MLYHQNKVITAQSLKSMLDIKISSLCARAGAGRRPNRRAGEPGVYNSLLVAHSRGQGEQSWSVHQSCRVLALMTEICVPVQKTLNSSSADSEWVTKVECIQTSAQNMHQQKSSGRVPHWLRRSTQKQEATRAWQSPQGSGEGKPLPQRAGGPWLPWP